MTIPNFDTTIDFKEMMIETRRGQILQGAAQVFAEKGFHKATTKQIAKAAGVSEGTIYNYFGNKRDLLLELIEMIAVESLRGISTDEVQAHPKQFLTAFLLNRYSLAQTHGQFIAPIIAEVFADPQLRRDVYTKIEGPLAEFLEGYFQRQIAAGRFRPINTMLVTRALVGGMIFNTAFKVSGLEAAYADISAEAMVAELVDLVLQGVLRPD